MARPDAHGGVRRLPTVVQSAVGIVALSAVLGGAAVQRRRRRSRSGATERPADGTVWATSGSTGHPQVRDSRRTTDG